MAHLNELLQKFCPDILERHELPIWFVKMADSRSRGKLAFVVWDRSQREEIIHADYYHKGEHLETLVFGFRLKK